MPEIRPGAPASTDFAADLAREQLASDRLRATLLAGLLTVILLVICAISWIAPKQFDAIWSKQLLPLHVFYVLAPGIAFELILRWHCGRLLETSRLLPPWMLYAVAFVEGSFPSAVILFLAREGLAPASVAGATAMLYFFCILLTTLRLSFGLAVFTGATAAVEYLFLAWAHLLDIAPEDARGELPLHIWRATMYLLAGIVAGLVAVQIRRQYERSLRAREDRQRVLDMFGKHVSPQVAEELLAQEVPLGGELRHVCVMFLDIRDFTARSSGRPPDEVVGFLNQLFDFTIDAVTRNHGIVNKFLGDGFMAIFGAPISDGRESAHAVDAAREIVAQIEKHNAASPNPPTLIGIGLHAGPAVAGTVGSRDRREYTIIGDTVNVASRIESLNKQFGSTVLASEEVWREAGSPAGAERLGPVPVKGKPEPIAVYKLI